MDPVKFYKCLSDDTRLKCLLLISKFDAVCVCDFVTTLKLEQSKISRHLAELRKCEILQDERRGKWVFYRFHAELPQWARQVIVDTAEHNHEYFKSAFGNLQSLRAADTSCC